MMSVSECNECSVCIVGSQADGASSPACGGGAEAQYKKAVYCNNSPHISNIKTVTFVNLENTNKGLRYIFFA